MKQYPEDVRRIVQGGHDIGNHSATHRNMVQLEKEEIEKELKETHQAVKELTGKEMKVSLSHLRAFNDTVILTAKEGGYLTVMGNIDSMDWKDYGAKTILRTVMEDKELQRGSIIQQTVRQNIRKRHCQSSLKVWREKGSVGDAFTAAVSGSISFRCERKADPR